jgi:hypothetical protein
VFTLSYPFFPTNTLFPTKKIKKSPQKITSKKKTPPNPARMKLSTLVSILALIATCLMLNISAQSCYLYTKVGCTNPACRWSYDTQTCEYASRISLLILDDFEEEYNFFEQNQEQSLNPKFSQPKFVNRIYDENEEDSTGYVLQEAIIAMDKCLLQQTLGYKKACKF